MKKVLILLLLFTSIWAQNSRFEKVFRKTDGSFLTGATIYIVNQSTGDSLQLTEHSTRTGTYYRDNVKWGLYKIYVNGALVTSNYWHGTDRARLFVEAVDTDGDNKIETIGIEDAAITSSKIADGTIATADIANSAVTNAKLADNAVTTTKILDSTITKPKLSPAVYQYIDASGGGTITNNPDDHTIHVNQSNALYVDTTGNWMLPNNDKKINGNPTKTGLDSVGLWGHITNNKIISVKDYGAKGDGVTNDSLAFAKAFKAAFNNYGTVYIPEGTYKVTGPIYIPPFNKEGNMVLIKGAGRGMTIINVTNDAPFISLDSYVGTQMINLQDMTIKGVGSATSTTAGVFLDSTSQGFIRDVTVTGFKYGFRISQCNAIRFEGARARYCWAGFWFENNSHEATLYGVYTAQNDSMDIYLHGSSKSIVFVGGMMGYSPYAVYIDSSSSGFFTIIGTNFENSERAFFYMPYWGRLNVINARIGWGVPSAWLADIGEASYVVFQGIYISGSTSNEADVILRGQNINVLDLTQQLTAWQPNLSQKFELGLFPRYTDQVVGSRFVNRPDLRGRLRMVYSRNNSIYDDAVIFYQLVNDSIVIVNYLSDGSLQKFSTTGNNDFSRKDGIVYYSGYKDFTTSAGDSTEVDVIIPNSNRVYFPGATVNYGNNVIDAYAALKEVRSGTTTDTLRFLVWHKKNTSGGLSMRLYFRIIAENLEW